MGYFFSITLGVSIVGIVLLLTVKHWENTSGKVLGASVRPRVGVFFHRTLVWCEQVLPRLLRTHASRTAHELRVRAHYYTAHTVLVVERALERSLRFLQHATEPKRGTGEASVFLREVGEHKKKLLKRSSSGTKAEEK